MRASQPWCFFCVITPGLEELALAEFLEKRELLGTAVDPVALPGGFEVTLPWEQGRALTAVLKIPTRVMVRLTTVTARDFPKLFQKASDLPWTQWLSHPEPVWKVSIHQCRLMHSGRVEETLIEAMKKAHVKKPFSNRWKKENLPQETIYVRGVDDVWTFSLDITGIALYKRGVSDIKGEAPLRETLAAACLRFLFNQAPSGPIHLWDPMCGSGTFLFEALGHQLPTEREFAYQTSQLNLGVTPWKPKATLVPWPIEKCSGHDLNPALVNRLAGQDITWGVHDIIKAPQVPKTDRPLWIISNPPYGERLALPEGIPEFTRKLSESLSSIPCERVLLLVPASWPDFKIKERKPQEILRFTHGGLAVEARLWKL